MEGVTSTRLGRSSTRYGPTTVFTGPVRKWKKRWVEISPPSNAPPPLPPSQNTTSSSSHLLLYKWTPATSAAANNGATKDPNKEDLSPPLSEDAPRRKFRYVPIVSMEEDQKKEGSTEAEEDEKKDDTDSRSSPKANEGATPNSADLEMIGAEVARKDSSSTREADETSLDLNLGLKSGSKSTENDHGADSKMGE